MVRKNNAGFTKFADVIILETPTPLVSSNVSIRQPPPPLKSADVLYGWSHIVNATPILLFLDLGHDGDGNGTLVQCAWMTIAFHILPYFFPSQHTTLVLHHAPMHIKYV